MLNLKTSHKSGPFSVAYLFVSIISWSFFVEVDAHVGAWHKGMYCMKGNVEGNDDQNTSAVLQPLYNLSKADWWFHHVNQCDEFPPAPGDFLEIPANGKFTVEHANNRAFTTTAANPVLGTFVDGAEHPNLGITDDGKDGGCIVNPNIHTQNETMAAGTAFAISYQSDSSQVTPENLVVFSVLYNTPWQRLATYESPDLPACPAGGCICAVNVTSCGEPNMYMQGYRCIVTNVNPDTSRILAPAKPAVWCEEDSTKCQGGSKQMIYWNQLDGNNIHVTGYDKFGRPKSPGYGLKLGFENGAQHDIFLP
ncbi:hypothetical protein B0H34DRAFT_782604 [Crassisporium funariophilum]|nr:hypothetical protein B0H34DRAFT_782604 [Crassisporium funariophilum]